MMMKDSTTPGLNYQCQWYVALCQVMLEEVMRAEMLYHCRALELLESVCVNVRQLDPDRAMQV